MYFGHRHVAQASLCPTSVRSAGKMPLYESEPLNLRHTNQNISKFKDFFKDALQFISSKSKYMKNFKTFVHKNYEFEQFKINKKCHYLRKKSQNSIR